MRLPCGQISQAQLVAEPPEHHESDNVTRVLRTVQQTRATLIELFCAVTAAEPAIALRRTLRPLRDGCQSAFRATHLALPPQRGGSYPRLLETTNRPAQSLTEPQAFAWQLGHNP